MQSSYPFMFLAMITLAIALSRGVKAIDYTVTNNAASTPGGTVFANQIGEDYARQKLASATDFIWQTFQQDTNTADRKPGVDQVSLTIVPTLSAVAITSSNKVQVSAQYLGTFSGDVKEEFTGVIYHEMTHVWQWTGNGQGNPGLIEGIADYVRLKAGYIANGWVKPGDGDKWDAGYSVTARFLDYCDSLMGGFVAQLNKKMKDGYSDSFFEDLLGTCLSGLCRMPSQ
ncbi:Basic secretory protease [Bienertia sinuspersici]